MSIAVNLTAYVKYIGLDFFRVYILLKHISFSTVVSTFRAGTFPLPSTPPPNLPPKLRRDGMCNKRRGGVLGDLNNKSKKKSLVLYPANDIILRAKFVHRHAVCDCVSTERLCWGSNEVVYTVCSLGKRAIKKEKTKELVFKYW